MHKGVAMDDIKKSALRVNENLIARLFGRIRITEAVPLLFD